MAITDDPDIVLATKRRFSDFLLDLDGVNAVGVGAKSKRGSRDIRPAIAVFVTRKLPIRRLLPDQRIPRTLPAHDPTGTPISDLEVATDVAEGGPFQLAQKNVTRQRPIVPGFSTSILEKKVLGGFPGTVGAALVDLNSGVPASRRTKSTQYLGEGYVVPEKVGKARERFFLTCAHVVAPSGDASKNLIVQPGQGDGGAARDIVGKPDRWTPWPQHIITLGGKTYQTTYTDAAAVKLDETRIKASIQDIGLPTGLRIVLAADATRRLPVQKSGRTTGLTKGTVSSSFADVKLGFGGFLGAFADPILYRDQIVADLASDGGDSGALVLDGDRLAVGLLVGGGDWKTIVTPINRVMFDLNHPRLARGTANRVFALAMQD